MGTRPNATPFSDVPPPSSPPAWLSQVVVSASLEHLRQAQDAVRLLNASGRFAARWCAPQDVAGQDEPPQLLLRIVGVRELDDAMLEFAAYRERHGVRPMMAVTFGLSMEASSRLLESGVNDFVCESASGDEFILRCARAIEAQQPRAPAPSGVLPHLRNLIGRSPAFAQQVARVPMLAKYDAGVLILGETGTGKEVCAQAIHYLSPRAGKPWVAVNCGAIPVDLIEAELFGHVKGAYTHAHTSRPGLVREAEGGTLFLDEIDSLPYSAQAKLLRFLQDKEYRPVGGNTVTRADVRVIAASNRQLAELAARGQFRQDLFFRLNVLMLHLPALRERRDDIPELATFFLRGAARQWQCAEPLLTASALRKLLAHAWPGNVRELKNVIERAVLMAQHGSLQAEDIDLDGAPAMLAGDAAAGDESFQAAKARVVENFERTYIQQLLASNGGNVTRAARAAKKNRRAFFELMRKHQIEPAPFRADVPMPAD